MDPRDKIRKMDPRAKEAKAARDRDHRARLDRAFDRVIGSQLSRIAEEKSKTLTEEDEEAYRRNLALEREAAERRGGREVSAEQKKLAASGLSGQVAALMAGKSGSDGDGDGSGRDRRKKKKKKRRRRDDDRKRKRRKKESSRKKETKKGEEEAAPQGRER